MTLFLWSVVFIASLAVLVKSADWFTESAERIGLTLGLSPFIVGVTIVALGTSFPELISGIAAAVEHVSEIVPANALGSNIANILLIVGLAAVIGGQLTVRKSLIDLDLPLLAIASVLMWGVFADGRVNSAEGLLLIAGYGIYLAYTILHREKDEAAYEEERGLTEVLPDRGRRRHARALKKPVFRPRLAAGDFLMILVGGAGLVIGAKYLVAAVVAIAAAFEVSAGLITITAVAVGTSLPELFVSVGAVLKKKYEVALGNVFGSNVFNSLIVLGVPALITPLRVDAPSLAVGLPAMLLATLLFIISGISRRIHRWEGLMFLLLYALFLVKLFALF